MSMNIAHKRDQRVRSLVMPKRILWVSENCESASVKDADLLLLEKYGQVPEGRFLAGSGCRMENAGASASLLIDFGMELHGGLQLASGGLSEHGMQVRIRFGESASEAMAELGERGACNDHAIRDTVIELPWAGMREIGNSGFRFCRIDLVTKGVLCLESVRAISLMRPMERLGNFRCNDERLNRVWDTAARTVHLCCQEYIWDGIKRDRLVWMGDMHPEMMALLAVFGNQDVLSASLDYMQKITPSDQWMNGMPSYTMWWLRCQHDLYMHYGNLSYLEMHHAYIVSLYDLLEKHIDDENRCSVDGFLDWPSKPNEAAVRAGMQALMLMTFENGIAIGTALGDAGLVATCRSCAARLRKYIPAPAGSKTAAALLALSGLLDAREVHDQVLACNGMEGISTFYGYYVLDALAAAGDVQRGLDTVRAYWGGMLDMGATSFWEDFDLRWRENAFRIDELPVAGKRDIHGDFGQFCYKGFRHSLCHGWSAGPAPWLIQHVLGIQITDVGCATVRISPCLGDLKWAEGRFPTPHGVISVRHEVQSSGRVQTDVSAPDAVQLTQA